MNEPVNDNWGEDRPLPRLWAIGLFVGLLLMTWGVLGQIAETEAQEINPHAVCAETE